MTLAAPYPRAEDRALLGTLVEALREGATEAPPWYLSHGQRWRWLVETLMGHPLIRGGQRPRDFPADPGGRRAVASAVEFQSRRVASWGQLPGELGGPFGEWLYAFFLLVEDLLRKAPAKAEGDGPEAPATREAVALEALLWLIWQTLRAAGLHQDEGSCHKLLAGIGMSIQDAGGLTAAYNPKSPWGDACRLRAVAQVGLAAEAALSAATAPRAKPLRHHREPVRALLKTRIWILTVKGFEIQKYIARTQTFWLARGASAWASQCLAEVRETLLELSEEGVIPTHLHLVTDVDAVVRFACLTEPDCGLIQAALEERIGLAWSRGDERFARKHPRLASFLDSLPAGLTGDLDPRCCLPHLCLERSAPRTLRQFCCRTRSKTEEERDEEKRAREQDGTRRIVRFPRQVPGAPACSYVPDEKGLVMEDRVPWLVGRLDKGLLGWSGMVWSLAGGTYRIHAAQGLGESLGESGLPLQLQHDPWLEALDESSSQVAYLKLDGDGVGTALGTMPQLRAFPAGLEIMHLTFQGLLDGAGAACRRWRLRHRGAPLLALPVDLIYLGGDDLMCNVPEPCVKAFLEGFADSPKPVGAPTFSGAVVVVPGGLLGPIGKMVSQVTNKVVPEALKLTKAKVKHRPWEEGLADLKRQAGEAGFLLTATMELERIGALKICRFTLEPLSHRARVYALGRDAGLGRQDPEAAAAHALHLEKVVRRVGRTAGCTDKMIAAAWLHDLPERLPAVTPKQLEQVFGLEVAGLVAGITAPGGPARAPGAAPASPEGQTLRLADLLEHAEAISAHAPSCVPQFAEDLGSRLADLSNGDKKLFLAVEKRIRALQG